MADRDILLRDLSMGAAAGAVATWLMGQVTSLLYERQNQSAKEAEQEARNGKQSYGVGAEKLAGVVGRELGDEQRQKAGRALHWALGIGTGAAYGVARKRVPGARLGAGLLFGTLFWLTVDEAMNSALGLTLGPRAFPWQTHARGLVGHWAYGVAAEMQLRGMDRAAHAL